MSNKHAYVALALALILSGCSQPTDDCSNDTSIAGFVEAARIITKDYNRGSVYVTIEDNHPSYSGRTTEYSVHDMTEDTSYRFSGQDDVEVLRLWVEAIESGLRRVEVSQ